MIGNFSFEGIEVDRLKMSLLKEYLAYTLNKKEILNFKEFRRNCGLSEKQWSIFREKNNQIDGVKWGF